MKRVVIIFPVGIYSSKSDGSVRLYEVDESFAEALGQANDIKVHAFTHKRDSTVVATLRLYESSLDGPPDLKGEELNSPTGYEITNSECYMQAISGPFCGRLKPVLEVKDSGSANPMSITLEIGATLFFD